MAGDVIVLGQRLAKILKRVCLVDRVAFVFTGGDIPHAHAHLVPLVTGDDITSRRYIVEEEITFRPTPRIDDDELAKIAANIRSETDR